jgi:hypothetical protein
LLAIRVLAACKHLKARLVVASRTEGSFYFEAYGKRRRVRRRRHAIRQQAHYPHSRSVAEHEREAISARTKAALAAAKARGVKLGGPKLKQAQRRGVASNKANADRFAANVLPIIQQIKASGATSLRAIAKMVNARGIATARGGVWTPVQVTAVQRRASLTKHLAPSQPPGRPTVT